MKLRKDALVSVRVDYDTRLAFRNKVEHEAGHDAASVLRGLIDAYIRGEVKIAPPKATGVTQLPLFGDTL